MSVETGIDKPFVGTGSIVSSLLGALRPARWPQSRRARSDLWVVGVSSLIPGLLLDAFRFLLSGMGSPQWKARRSHVTSALSRVTGGAFAARRRIATCAAVILAGMMGYHVVFGQNGLIAYRAKRDQVQALRTQMTELQTENTHLRNHVDRLGNDPNAIEHEAREALHYTRPGEVIYTMPQEPGNPR